MRRFLDTAIAAAILLCSAASANASVLASGVAVADVSNPRPAGTVFNPVGATNANVGGIAAPINFFSGSGLATIDVTDCCTVGDVFEVILDGVSLGLTSQVGVGGATNSFGHFELTLGNGSHALNLWDITLAYLGTNSPFGGEIVTEDYVPAGVNYVINGPDFVRDVPEPGVLALIGIGLAAAAITRRRSSSASARR